MADMFLSPLLEVLFNGLMSGSVLDYASQFVGISASELKKWENRLRMMEAVLIDAEEKQLTDRAVKKWLDDLRDLAYDVEDVLDEFATEAAKRELKSKYHSKGRSLIAAPFSKLKFNRNMAARVKGVTSRLDELCEMKDKLRLVVTAGVAASSTNSVSWRPPSTCLPPEYDVGRNDEKEKILESVLRDDSMIRSDFNFQAVSIVGLGGIGKTTLARAVYNNSRVVNNFNLRSWVCISQEFDVMRISKAILESLTSSSCSSKELNQVQVQLKEHLAGKKFLVVLDDVWSNEYAKWEALRSPLLAGAPGSKIVVTTRSTSVASMFGSTCCCQLKPLSDDVCWFIFKKHAGSHRDSEAIREKVVKRCGGLPLAARTLGGLLRCKEIHEWEWTLNNKLWELSHDRCEILPVLRLSYEYLPAHLKRCFAYCAIFSEDYEFEEMEVVLLWMAEGLIQESRGNKEMEDLGREYFRDLLSRSLFQRSNNDSTRYIMHDLVNALAQKVSGETSFRLEHALTSTKISKDLRKVRHSSYSCDHYELKIKLEIFNKMPYLRTFLPISPYKFNYISNMVVYDLLPKLKTLRVLSLKGYEVYELPDLIGDLIHLRILNLARTLIRSLPESTCTLLNLQTLILKDCDELRKLPSKLNDLVNLHYLDIRGANLITEMPIGMGKLKSLRKLSNFIASKGRGSDFKDLKNLKYLCGELCISRLENVHDVNEAILSDMNYLNMLILEWGYTSDNISRDEQVERKVLDMLRPHTNLEELTITGYPGNDFPSWIGDSTFRNMKVLRLMNCKNCTSLPLLGQLSCLKELTIQGIRLVRMISSEIYGESLEILSLKDLEDWEQWDPMQGDVHVSRFPRLRKLFIIDCPKLSGNLPQNLSLLEKLEIQNCGNFVVTLSNFPELCDICIDGCQKIVCNNPHNSKQVKSMTLSCISDSKDSLIQGFEKVDYLNIKDCENLISRWQYDLFLETPSKELHSLTSLVELCIKSCPSLILIPNFCSLPILKNLEITDCNALTSLPNGIAHKSSHLESLSIKYCDSITFIATGQLPSSLKRLFIMSCEKLQYLILGEREDASTLSCSSTSSISHEEPIINGSITVLLDTLEIDDCPSLTCLFSNCMLPTIKDLSIENCRNLTTLFSKGQLPDLLQRLFVIDCSKLESVAKRFHNQMSLEYLSIFRCENLKSIPDGLQDLNRLREICISMCPNLVCFPQGGLPSNISKVEISNCENLQAPSNFLHNLNSLQELIIFVIPRITLLQEEGLPTTLTRLGIEGDHNIFMPLIKWGLHKLTTLKTLTIYGCQDAVSFPEEEKSMSLPPSLTRLTIFEFPKLKYLSSRGFKTLTSLEYLMIDDCPKLTSFPKEDLPSSLLELYIKRCPSLKKRCRRDRGREWHKISHIPCVVIDWRSIYDPDQYE